MILVSWMRHIIAAMHARKNIDTMHSLRTGIVNHHTMFMFKVVETLLTHLMHDTHTSV